MKDNERKARALLAEYAAGDCRTDSDEDCAHCVAVEVLAALNGTEPEGTR